MSGSANSVPPKVDPETLVLRASPRRATRFKRGLLIGIAAVGCVFLFGAAWLALGTGSLKKMLPGPQYNVDQKAPADQIAGLPKHYDQLKAPKLGAPLPGDLGPPVVRAEHDLGLSPSSLRPNTEEEAVRTERLRIAQESRQASESGVLFRVSGDQPGPAEARNPATAMTGSVPSAGSTPSALSLDPTRDPNNQGRKLEFVGGKADDSIYNPHSLQKPASPYEVMAGTIISASLITGINSDLPGLVVAQVTADIWGGANGAYLLIPQGSRLLGSYDSVVAFGQSRALLVWQRIIMPNGTSVQIDNLPATDTAGYAGLEDQVDYHAWKLLEGVALSTLLGVGSQVAFGNNNSNLVEAIRQSTQESTNQAGQRIVEKDLDLQPTLKIRPGWPLRVIVHKDIVLQPYAG